MKKAVGNGLKVKYKFPYFTLIDLSKIRLVKAIFIPLSNYVDYATIKSQVVLKSCKFCSKELIAKNDAIGLRITAIRIYTINISKDLAFEFKNWIKDGLKPYMIKECYRHNEVKVRNIEIVNRLLHNKLRIYIYSVYNNKKISQELVVSK